MEHLTFRQEWQEDSPVIRSVEQALGAIVSKESHPRLASAAFVNVNNDQELRELKKQLADDPALPVVLMGPELEKVAKEHPDLATIVRYPNVRSTVSGTFLRDVITAFQGPRAPLLSQEAAHATLERARSSIQHDLRNAVRGGDDHKRDVLVRRARNELGLMGEDQEVIDAVMAAGAPVEVSEYMDVNAVCVDWEGTLSQNGAISQDVLSRVQSEAEQRGVRLIVWTGGDVNGVYAELRNAGIENLHVCSKQDCKGLKVKAALDDEPLEELKNKYGLDAEEML